MSSHDHSSKEAGSNNRPTSARASSPSSRPASAAAAAYKKKRGGGVVSVDVSPNALEKLLIQAIVNAPTTPTIPVQRPSSHQQQQKHSNFISAAVTTAANATAAAAAANAEERKLPMSPSAPTAHQRSKAAVSPRVKGGQQYSSPWVQIDHIESSNNNNNNNTAKDSPDGGKSNRKSSPIQSRNNQDKPLSSSSQVRSSKINELMMMPEVGRVVATAPDRSRPSTINPQPANHHTPNSGSFGAWTSLDHFQSIPISLNADQDANKTGTQISNYIQSLNQTNNSNNNNNSNNRSNNNTTNSNNTDPRNALSSRLVFSRPKSAAPVKVARSKLFDEYNYDLKHSAAASEVFPVVDTTASSPLPKFGASTASPSRHALGGGGVDESKLFNDTGGSNNYVKSKADSTISMPMNSTGWSLGTDAMNLNLSDTLTSRNGGNKKSDAELSHIYSALLSSRKEGLFKRPIDYSRFTIEDAILYVLDSALNKERSTHSDYLLVTPRFNIEPQPKPNLYDLVVIEEPGYPIGTKDRMGFNLTHMVKDKQTTVTIDKYSVWELSRKGLLYYSEPSFNSLSIFTLSEFISEKKMRDDVNRLHFFTYFKEFKYFYSWKTWVKRTIVSRARDSLMNSSIFSLKFLISVVQLVKASAYALENEIDMFYYHGFGSISLRVYFERQSAHINDCKNLIIDRVNKLLHELDLSYKEATSLDRVLENVEKIKPNHPYLRAEHMGINVDWTNVNAVKRFNNEIKYKFSNMLVLGQILVDRAISKIVGNFWVRFKLFMLGLVDIKSPYKSMRNKKSIYYGKAEGWWDLALQQSLNTNSCFDFESPDKFPIADDIRRLLKIEQIKASDKNKNKDSKSDTAEGEMAISDETKVDPGDKDIVSCNFSYISDTLELQGSHPSVLVSLVTPDIDIGYDDSYDEVISAALRGMNISKFKVSVVPDKATCMEDMHRMLGKIGELFENIPNLKRHNIVTETKEIESDPSPDDYDDVLSEPISTKYFARLLMYPVLNCGDSLKSAIDSIKLLNENCIRIASVKCLLDPYLGIFRKLFNLDPVKLTKKLSKSNSIPQLYQLTNTLDNIEYSSSWEEDRRHLLALNKAVELLEMYKGYSDSFPNIKFSNGYIVSFTPVNTQYNIYRLYQYSRLYLRLPISFTKRCQELVDLFKSLDRNLKLEKNDYDGLVLCLRKLKFFDAARPMIDLEMEIVQTMFLIIERSQGSEELLSALSGKGITMPSSNKSSSSRRGGGGGGGHSGVGGRASSNFGDILGLYKLYGENRKRLFETVESNRTQLAEYLPNIKAQTLMIRKSLQDLVISTVERIMMHSIVTKEDNGENKEPLHILISIKATKNEILTIKKQVKLMVDSQLLLVESTDITKSSQLIMGSHEVEYFPQIEDLESSCALRFKAWSAIVEAVEISKKLNSSRPSLCDIQWLNDKVDNIISLSCSFSNKSADEDTLLKLNEIVSSLKPKVFIISSLASPFLKYRHWKWLADNVLNFIKLFTKFSGQDNELMQVIDVSGKSNFSLGQMTRIELKEFVERGICTYIEKVRHIVSKSYIEALIEDTIEKVNNCVNSIRIVMSMDWLRNAKMREKLVYELYQAINLKQITVTLQYCKKSLLLIENTSYEMNVVVQFESRVASLVDLVTKLENFVEDYIAIQNMWIYCFVFVKFWDSAELDKDTPRLYQLCTEELKKVEKSLQEKGCSLVLGFNTINQNSLSVTSIRNNLATVVEDIHTNLQSIIDGCPRLSMLSFSRLSSLVKIWLLGPATNLDFVSKCVHEIYEHIGAIKLEFNAIMRENVCVGFVSDDGFESLSLIDDDFAGISFKLPIEEFFRSFDLRYKVIMSQICDKLVLERIIYFQNNYVDVNPRSIASNHVGDCLSVRWKQLRLLSSDAFTNQSLLLMDQVFFAEDVWTCIGHPTGGLVFGRPDISNFSNLFSVDFQKNLHMLFKTCSVNIENYQHYLFADQNPFKMSKSKSSSLLSSLLQLELHFFSILEEMTKFTDLEKVREYWAAHYQLRFVYRKEVRVDNIPIDINLGCMTLAYGMEYQGSRLRAIPTSIIQKAIHGVVGAATDFKGSIFIQDVGNLNLVSVGESSFTVKDISYLLGRLHFTLSSFQNQISLRFFFSRLIYLDAIGSVDLMGIDHAALQSFIFTINLFWSALEKKNDYFIQECLKYPVKTKFQKNELQLERKNKSVYEFRTRISLSSKLTIFNGLLAIGLISSSASTDPSVLTYVSKSIFNIFVVDACNPIENMNVVFSAEGFRFANELKSTLEVMLINIKEHAVSIYYKLNSAKEMREITQKAAKCLKISLSFAPDIKGVPRGRFLLEMESLMSTFWTRTVLACMQDDKYWSAGDLKVFKNQVFYSIYQRITKLVPDQQIEEFQSSLGENLLCLTKKTNRILTQSFKTSNVVPDNQYLSIGGILMEMISNSNNNVVIISGDSGVGKTTICNAVLLSMKKCGNNSIFYGNLSLSQRRHQAADLIYQCIANLKARRLAKARHRTTTAAASKGGSAKPENVVDADAPVKLNSQIEGMDNLKSWLSKRNDTAKTFTNRVNEVIHDDVCEVKSTVIYHTSISMKYLVGFYDNNTWCDGLLLRKLREVGDADQAISLSGLPIINAIILDGPIGYNIEHLFTSAAMNSQMTTLDSYRLKSGVNALFPSGESYELPPSVKIIMETHDISQASPTFLFSALQLNVSVPIDIIIKSLLTAWLRSVSSWLSYFIPWQESLDFMSQILLRTTYIKEFLSHDIPLEKLKSYLVVSRLGSFFRFFEALLIEIHAKALVNAVFLSSAVEASSDEDNASSDEDNASSNNDMRSGSSRIKSDLSADKLTIMSLSDKEKEKLMNRVTLALVYSSIWGFGGASNISSHMKKKYESSFKDSILLHLGSVPFNTSCSLFDQVIDLDSCELVKAAHKSSYGDIIIKNYGLPKAMAGLNIYAELLNDMSKNESHLIIHTPMTRALDSALRMTLAGSSNCLLLGPSSCGKSFLLSRILKDLGQNIPTPEFIRQHILNNIVEIIYERQLLTGAPKALKAIQAVLASLESAKSITDNQMIVSQIWLQIQEMCQDSSSAGVKKKFEERNVRTTMTSIRSNDDGDSLRNLIQREYATEIEYNLETPRYSHGLLFVDDLHLCLDDENDLTKRRYIENRPEAVLKGLASATPLFSFQRSLRCGHAKVKLEIGGSTFSPSIMHRNVQSDSKRNVEQPDNFFIQYFGLLAAGIGDIRTVSESSRCQYILPKFISMAMPELEFADLHVSLISGAVASLSSFYPTFEGSIIDVLKGEINELCEITTFVCSKLVNVLLDNSEVTSLEKSVRSLTLLNISLVVNFCNSLRLGGKLICNPGGLLQLFYHQWKHFFLDPLPEGAQRNFSCSLFRSQLENKIKPEHWNISDIWLDKLIDDLTESSDKVIINTIGVMGGGEFGLKSSDESADCTIYQPLNVNLIKTARFYEGGSWNPDDEKYAPLVQISELEVLHNRIKSIDLSNFSPCGMTVKSILYPAGISMILRLMRALGSQRNILISGNFGDNRHTAVHIAAKLYGYEVMSLNIKESYSVVEMGPSSRSIRSMNVKNFLKTVFLSVCGFISEPGVQFPTYKFTRPSKILMYLQNVQQLNDEDKRILVELIEFSNPLVLFSNLEILGMAKSIQKQSLDTEKSEAVKLKSDADVQRDMIISQKDASSISDSMQAGDVFDDDDGAENDNSSNIDNLVNNLNTTAAPSPDNTESLMGSNANSDFTGRNTPLLTGYTYHWIKDHLKSYLSSLITIFDITVMTSTKIHETHVNVNDQKHQSSSHTQPSGKQESAPLPAPEKTSNGTSTSTHPSASAKGASNYRESFSSLSSLLAAKLNRVLQDQQSDNSEKEKPKKRMYSRMSEYMKNGNTPHDHSNKYDENAVDENQSLATAALTDGGQYSAHHHGIYTCYLIGPLLGRQFNPMWWNIDPSVAIEGICKMTLENVESNRDSYAIQLESGSIGDLEYKMLGASGKIREDMALRKSSFRPSNNSAAYVIELKVSKENNFSDYLSIYDQIGAVSHLLGNLSLFAEIPLSTDFSKKLTIHKAVLLEEARNILPKLLSLPLPNDAVLLRVPLLVHSHEKFSESAATIVENLFSKYVSTLLQRKYMLEQVFETLGDGKTVINDNVAISSSIASQNEEISVVYRKIRGKIDSLRKESLNIQSSYFKSYSYEQLLMGSEEIISIETNVTRDQERCESISAAIRSSLSAITKKEMKEWCELLQTKPLKPENVDLIRDIIALFNYSPKKTHKGEQDSSGKLNDDAAVKYGCVFLKSADFLSNAVHLDFKRLSPSSIANIRARNEALNQEFRRAPKYQEMKYLEMTTLSAYHESSENHLIFDTFRRLFFVIDVCSRSEAHSALLKSQVFDIKANILEIKKQSEMVMAKMRSVLQQKIEILSENAMKVDTFLSKNRVSMDYLQKVNENLTDVNFNVKCFESFISNEMGKINDILTYIIGDICIAAVVTARCGWQPESFRQVALETLRAHASAKLSTQTSNTPFLLGSLMDRLQIRNWTSSSTQSSYLFFNNVSRVPFSVPITKDSSSINAMSLLYLTPHFTYIVDPEGFAEQAMIEHPPKGYELCLIPAQKFSLSQLETWIHTLIDLRGESSSLCLLITEMQAGASDDLISFLSSDLVLQSNSHGKVGGSNYRGDRSIPRAAGGGASDASHHGHSHAQRQRLQKLFARLNPFDKNFDTSSENYIKLCKLRLYAFSTTPPTLNEDGLCNPIPLSCFNNMTIINWTNESQSGAIVDSEPLGKALFKNSVDFSWHYAFTNPVLFKVSPNFNQQLTMISEAMASTEVKAYTAYEKIIVSIYKWMSVDKEIQAVELHLVEFGKFEPISVSFWSNDIAISAIKAIKEDILHSNYLLDCYKNVEKEYLKFQSVFMEIFTMSIDFLRVCNKVLEADLFSPYAMTAKAIIAKAIIPAIQKASEAGFLFGVPENMGRMKLITRSIIVIQRKFRLSKTQVINAANKDEIKRERLKQMPMNSIEIESVRLAHKTNDIMFAAATDFSKPRSTRFAASGSKTFREYTPQEKADVGGGGKKSLLRRNQKNDAFSLFSDTMHLGPLQSNTPLSYMFVNDLVSLLNPLKMYFMQVIVNYVQKSIKPGSEWLVKFCYLLVQNSLTSTLPEAELKILFKFLYSSMGIVPTHYVNYNPVTTSLSKAAYQDPTKRKGALRKISSFTRSSYTVNLSFSSKTKVDNVMRCKWMMRYDGNILGLLFNKRYANLFVSRLPVTQNQNEVINSVAEKPKPSASNSTKTVAPSKTAAYLWKSKYNTQEFAGATQMFDIWLHDHFETQKMSRKKNNDTMFNFGFEIEWSFLHGSRLFSMNNMDALKHLKTPKTVIDAIHSNHMDILNHSLKDLNAAAKDSKNNDKQVDKISNSDLRKSVRIKSRVAVIQCRNSGSSLPHAANSKAGDGNINNCSSSSSSSHGVGPENDLRKNNAARKGSILTSGFLLKSKSIENSEIASITGASEVQLDKVERSLERSFNKEIKGLGSHRKSLAFNRMSPLPSPRGSFSLPVTSDNYGMSQESVSFRDYILQPSIWKNLSLLETLSQTERVFRGIQKGIFDKLDEFALWKSTIDVLDSFDIINFEESDLTKVLDAIKPPMFEPLDEDEDAFADEIEQGCWLKGQELTVYQTMIFAEVIKPGCCEKIAEVHFASLMNYIKKGGSFVSRNDLIPDDENLQEFKNLPHALLHIPLADESNLFDINEDDKGSDSEDNIDKNEEGDKANIREAKNVRFIYQDGVQFSNCWTMLHAVVDNSVLYQGFIRNRNNLVGFSKYQLSYRDYYDCESFFYKFCTDSFETNKFLYMSELRNALSGNREALFLGNRAQNDQFSTISQRARDLSFHLGLPITMYNCMTHERSANDASVISDQKDYRSKYVDINKMIRSSGSQQGSSSTGTASSTGSGVIVNTKSMCEMVDFSSSYGNSIFSAAVGNNPNYLLGLIVRSQSIVQSVLEKERSVSKSLSNIYFMSLFPNKEKKNNPDILFASVVAPKQFPLLISGLWDGTHAKNSHAPLQILSEYSFNWLPRLSVVDIIGNTSLGVAEGHLEHRSFNVKLKQQRFVGILPTGRESGSILCEELETSLLKTIATMKVLSKSTLAASVRDRLKNCSKLDIRSACSLLTIYRMLMFLKCLEYEAAGLEILRGVALVPPSIWQYSRLLIKIVNIFTYNWRQHSKRNVPLNTETLFSNDTFLKAIVSLAECFETIDVNALATSKAHSEEDLKGGDAEAKPIILSQERILLSAHKKGTAFNDTISVAVEEASGFKVKDKSLTEKKIEKDKKDEKKKVMTNKAKRDLLKLKQKILDEVRTQLTYISDVDRFLKNETALNDLNAPLHVKDVKKKTEAINENMKKRMITLFAHLMAKIIVELDIFNPSEEEVVSSSSGVNNNKSASEKSDNSYKSNNVEVASMFIANQSIYQRRMSTKTDIKSFLENSSSAKSAAEAKLRGMSGGQGKKQEVSLTSLFLADCSLGAFNSEDILLFIFRWTTDGYVSSMSQSQKGVLKKSMLKAIKKMAGVNALNNVVTMSFKKN